MSIQHCKHCYRLHDTDFNAEHEDECAANPENCAAEQEEEMTDSEMWAAHKEERREKKQDNERKSLSLLKEGGYEVKTLNAGISHYRVEGYDFWPTTGKFYNQSTGDKGRGVFDLIRRIKHKCAVCGRRYDPAFPHPDCYKEK